MGRGGLLITDISTRLNYIVLTTSAHHEDQKCIEHPMIFFLCMILWALLRPIKLEGDVLPRLRVLAFRQSSTWSRVGDSCQYTDQSKQKMP